jgi:hypothetical protein
MHCRLQFKQKKLRLEVKGLAFRIPHSFRHEDCLVSDDQTMCSPNETRKAMTEPPPDTRFGRQWTNPSMLDIHLDKWSWSERYIHRSITGAAGLHHLKQRTLLFCLVHDGKEANSTSPR